MSFVPVKLKGREVEPYKAVVSPLIGERTVLTNSPWTYVGLWLRREKKSHSLFYWEQAQQFHQVSVGLPLRTAPLLLYYCYMNAVKALLSAKGVPFDERHGTKALSRGKRGTFYTEGVRISTKGILPSLITYYGETEIARTHTLQQLLFNMVFIHRTYALTFTSQEEMYLPLTNCTYNVERGTKRVFLTADISARVPLKPALKRIPPNFVSEPRLGALGGAHGTDRNVAARACAAHGQLPSRAAALVRRKSSTGGGGGGECHVVNKPRQLEISIAFDPFPGIIEGADGPLHFIELARR
jgi:hypothetical protein